MWTVSHTLRPGLYGLGSYKVNFLSWKIAVSCATYLNMTPNIQPKTAVTQVFLSPLPQFLSVPLFFPDIHPDREECVSLCVLQGDDERLQVSAELDDSVFKKV